LYPEGATSAEFRRWLEEQGCTFEPGKGLAERIKKDLRLK
jgi:hypothetical protein